MTILPKAVICSTLVVACLIADISSWNICISSSVEKRSFDEFLSLFGIVFCRGGLVHAGPFTLLLIGGKQDLDTEEKMRRDESSFSHLQAKDEKEESSQSSSG